MEEKNFIDRIEELSKLREALERKGAELIILYGRRRIGKSRLLKEAERKTKNAIFVMMEDADYSTNLKKFSEAVAKNRGLPSFSPKSFREAFESINEMAVVFIDEYSYIGNATGEFQAIWEEVAKPKKIKLLLSGSLVRVMEDLNYSLKSPLYGRATMIMKVNPLAFQHVIGWYGEKSGLEKVFQTYFSVGGVPRYLEIIEKPGKEHIMGAFFSKNGLLLREGKLLLKESFPSSNIFPKILFSIAGGATEATKIANETQLKANEISKYLAILADYGFVEKRYPLLDAGKKDTRFYVADNFFAFWALFVWPHYTDLDAGANENALDYFSRGFDEYSGAMFEKTILEILRMKQGLAGVKFTSIGRQWGRFKGERGKNTYDIDILAVNRQTKEALFGECKWSKNVDALQIAHEINGKTKYVKWNDLERKEILAVFAKSFSRKISELDGKPVKCFDLEDIQKIIGKTIA